MIHSLSMKKGKTPPKKEQVAFLEEDLIPFLIDQETEILMVTDAGYFKTLSGQAKADAVIGYAFDSPYGPWKVIYLPNYTRVFYDPENIKPKIDIAFLTCESIVTGEYQTPGSSIIHSARYPDSLEAIKKELDALIDAGKDITLDLECFDLKHYKSGIGTVSIATDKHNGIAFKVDLQEIEGAKKAPYSAYVPNEERRALLRDFLLRFKGKVIYHNIAFDAYILIYVLFMKDLLDTEGLLNGMDLLLANWDCTKHISYLATNSCAGNDLSLKSQAQEFAGNYAQEEIKDIRKIKVADLLQYNLVDALSTWYVFEKNYPIMVEDQQNDIYQNIFKPATVDIIQMQLTGLPLDMERTKEVAGILEKDCNAAIDKMRSCSIVSAFEAILREKTMNKKNSTWVNKRIEIDDPSLDSVVFNPESGPQLQAMLFGMLDMPVLATTKSGAPSTSGDTLEDLRHHTKDPEILKFLEAMMEYKAVAKILSAFIPHMLNAPKGPDNWHYLFGSFNLGGTISGRLSSSKINLQQLPSTGSKYAKVIKSCFKAPPGWVLCGLDFDSLEDKISALTTKDPNKLAVYQGHIIYELNLEGVTHHIRDDSIIEYDGKTYTGQQLYDSFSKI